MSVTTSPTLPPSLSASMSPYWQGCKTTLQAYSSDSSPLPVSPVSDPSAPSEDEISSVMLSPAETPSPSAFATPYGATKQKETIPTNNNTNNNANFFIITPL